MKASIFLRLLSLSFSLWNSVSSSARVQELIEKRGCELLFLPPYSLDLNPIEEAFSKIIQTVSSVPGS